MKTKPFVLALTIVLISSLLKPQFILAQAMPDPIRGSWEGLKAIPPGDELTVGLRNGQTIKGRMSTVTDTVLTLSQGNKTTDLSRGDVLRVNRLILKSARRSILIGLGIGAGVGVGGAIAASGGESGDYALGILIVGLIGIGVGTLVGYLIGSRKQSVLIYETR